MEYTIEKRSNTRTLYNVIDQNSKKETLSIEIVECKNLGGNNALPVLWQKNGYIDRVLDTYLCLDVYCYDSEAMCWGRYNPQVKLSEDGKRQVINFDWMFEATEENKLKLVNESIRLFEAAQGKSATELKLEKIYKFAEDRNLDIYTEIPEGWEVENAMTYPIGSTKIYVGKLFMRNGSNKLVKNQDYREALLIQ